MTNRRTGIGGAVAIAMALALGGCGVDALRVQGAGDVTTASAAVVSQANAALDLAKSRREQAYATLIASDPSCLPVESLYVFVPVAPPAPGAAPPPLCASGPGDRLPGYRVVERHASVIGTEALKPTVALIAAMGDYEAALAKVVAEPKPDIANELQAIADKAGDARTLAELLTGSSLPALPDLASKQVKATTDILQFVATLAAQHGQARDIRRVVADQHATVARIRADLMAQLEEWQGVASTGYAQVVANNLRRAYANGRRPMDFSARLALLKSITMADNDLASIPQVTAALKQAMGKFAAADDILASRLSGSLSAADRKKAAEISRQQIFEGIHLIARAVAAWGMV